MIFWITCSPSGMVIGMAARKITITITDEQLAAIRELVGHRKADSVSAFVRHAISLALDDVAGWQQTLDDALARTGGPLTDDERRWADQAIRATRRSVA